MQLFWYGTCKTVIQISWISDLVENNGNLKRNHPNSSLFELSNVRFCSVCCATRCICWKKKLEIHMSLCICVEIHCISNDDPDVFCCFFWQENGNSVLDPSYFCESYIPCLKSWKLSCISLQPGEIMAWLCLKNHLTLKVFNLSWLEKPEAWVLY